MSKFKIVLIILFTVSFSLPVYCNNFATVNLSLVYNFHPLVQTYVPDEGYFMKIDKNDRGIFKKRSDDNRELINSCYDELDKIKENIKNLSNETDNLQFNCWQKKKKIENSIDINSKEKTVNETNLNQKLELNEKEYRNGLSKIAFKKELLLKKAAEIETKLKSVNYFTGAEHKSIVEKIKKEVNEAILEISKKYQLYPVINSTNFHMQRQENKRTARNTKIIESKNFIDTAVTETEIFLEPFDEVNVNNFIIAGGKDITCEVLEIILKKYKIEKTAINLITMGIKTKKLF